MFCAPLAGFPARCSGAQRSHLTSRCSGLRMSRCPGLGCTDPSLQQVATLCLFAPSSQPLAHRSKKFCVFSLRAVILRLWGALKSPSTQTDQFPITRNRTPASVIFQSPPDNPNLCTQGWEPPFRMFRMVPEASLSTSQVVQKFQNRISQFSVP